VAEAGVKELIGRLSRVEGASALYLYGRRRGFSDPARRPCIGLLLEEEAASGWRGRDPGGWDEPFGETGVEVVIMNNAPGFLKHHIIRKGAVVFQRSERYRLKFEQRAINTYLNGPAMDDSFCSDEMAMDEARALSLMEIDA